MRRRPTRAERTWWTWTRFDLEGNVLQTVPGAGVPDVRWLIVGSDGVPLGQARLPREVAPMWVSEGAVWAVEIDELGVPWLVRRTAEEAGSG